jgi:hypothetical protein
MTSSSVIKTYCHVQLKIKMYIKVMRNERGFTKKCWIFHTRAVKRVRIYSRHNGLLQSVNLTWRLVDTSLNPRTIVYQKLQ